MAHTMFRNIRAMGASSEKLSNLPNLKCRNVGAPIDWVRAFNTSMVKEMGISVMNRTGAAKSVRVLLVACFWHILSGILQTQDCFKNI